jgi:hypothetical protein
MRYRAPTLVILTMRPVVFERFEVLSVLLTASYRIGSDVQHPSLTSSSFPRKRRAVRGNQA